MSTEDVGRQLSSSAASKLHTREDGSLNVMASIGGVRGLLEAALPAAFFLPEFRCPPLPVTAFDAGRYRDCPTPHTADTLRTIVRIPHDIAGR